MIIFVDSRISKKIESILAKVTLEVNKNCQLSRMFGTEFSHQSGCNEAF